MDIQELRNGIRLTIQQIDANLPAEGATIGADAAALVESRIVERGERADGAKFSAYSTKPVPAFLYFGRSRNSGGEARVRKAAKDGEGVAYADFRRFNGLGAAEKNFQFTGEMWQGFGVRSVRVIQQGVIEIEIGGKNARSNLLLKAHSEREKSELTQNSPRELEMVTAGLSDRILTIIKRNMT